MNMHIAQDDPSAWVARFAGLIPAGRVLDLACGGGRHARLMAALGHAVLAVDRGARVVRVHDVQATVHALKVWQAVVSQSPAGQTLPTD
jgi:2-polyprenyl-3-methyl-5-hydroxy-6-metoxy-1,4-benzoquinol methylase